MSLEEDASRVAQGPTTDREPRVLRVCRAFLRHRALVAIIFAALAIAAALAVPHVKVNYSMTDYLPADTPAVQSLDDMKAAFGEGVTNANLYAEGIGLSQASDLADRLADVEGVSDVMWLGTAVDVREPLEVQDSQTVADWSTDEGFLYTFVVDDAVGVQAASDARAAAEAVGASQVSLSGDAITTASAQSSTSVEIIYILALGVAVVIIILLVASHSWFEPVIFLAVIGIAIVMNMGTNLILGQISFISQICGAILQLAVSMDYAIVLLHTYNRCRAEYPDPQDAMAHAMVRGFSVVLSSAAVTFFGFLSLSVMRFGLGVNMGIVLAKGIVFSFITIMFLMPCLVLLCRRPLEALEHRYLVPSFGKLARGCQRIMLPAAVVVIVAAVPAFLAEDRIDFVYGSSDFAAPDSQTGQETQRIEDAFGERQNWVVMVPEGDWAHEKALVDELSALEGVGGATSYTTVAGRAMPVEVAPADEVSKVIAGGWSRIVLTVYGAAESDQTFGLVEQVRDACAAEYGDSYRLVGNSVSLYDLRDTVQADSVTTKVFGMVAVGLVLALMFRSLAIPVLALAAIEVAIWLNLAFPYFMGTSLNYTGYLVIDAVQLGAAVDYAIIYAREYFDQRARHLPREAARAAIEHAGVPIVTSASILTLAGVATWLIASNGVISQLGVLVARGAFISMLMMFLFLPWLFRTFDGAIVRTTLGLHFRKKDGEGVEGHGDGPSAGGEEGARSASC